MIKVKTFPQTLKIFETMNELKDLDDRVSKFIKENNIKKVISISDTTTSTEGGSTIGIIRVMAYEE
jgi:hypothetical protein